ncbi:unnamed protein product [Oppiella nova]|uniref:Uncharacterized protein n=1 Tax=Oppiella nova TaxID=334625 RepID=A0A7R9LT45_9ACAR|nr:unnamed protein product [Oppiella nova]CAG2166722.1 unnamed protein product [Oppiella nova]
MTRVTIVGAKSSGKTTLLFNIILGEYYCELPVPGLEVDFIESDNLLINSFSVEHPDKYAPYWPPFYAKSSALVFLVDSCDERRLPDIKHVLCDILLADDQLRDAIVLIVATKQDMPGAMSVSDISAKLDLDNKLTGHKWNILVALVVDGTDISNMAAARNLLTDVLGECRRESRVKVLVMVNKCESRECLPCDRISDELGLHALTNRWHVCHVSAKNNHGLHEAWDWLRVYIKK